MKDQILKQIENPEHLEKMYRSNKREFIQAFFEVYPEIENLAIARFWKTRLEFNAPKSEIFPFKKTDLIFLFVSCLLGGILIKIPQIFSFSAEDVMFYEKNAGLIVLFGLSLFAFFTKEKPVLKQALIPFFVFVAAAVYINFLPSNRESSSVLLAFIHLPLFMWGIYASVFIDFNLNDKSKRMDFIKYNGELAVLMALISIAGGILTGVTIELFSAIGIQIGEFYFQNIVIWGMVAAPVVATFVIQNFPFVVNKIAPVIATIFSPLVLLTLLVYLVSIILTGKDPYNDRDFLIVFNLMLLGVMAIIVFSIAESSQNNRQRFNEMILFALSIITLVVDLVAVSAILYRLGEYGFTPNRIAVLGSNVLIFGNLVLIMIDLYRVNFKNKSLKLVENRLATYLPVYIVWTFLMVFLLPVLFRFQ